MDTDYTYSNSNAYSSAKKIDIGSNCGTQILWSTKFIAIECHIPGNEIKSFINLYRTSDNEPMDTILSTQG